MVAKAPPSQPMGGRTGGHVNVTRYVVGELRDVEWDGKGGEGSY